MAELPSNLAVSQDATPKPQDNQPLLAKAIAVDIAPNQLPEKKYDQVVQQGDGTYSRGNVISNTTNEYSTTVIQGGGVAGANKQIQFNDGGSIGADADFKWDKVGNELLFGKDTDITGASGASSGDSGSYIQITSGSGNVAGAGGAVVLLTGNGGTDGNGGALSATAGDSGTVSGNGGDVTITAGASYVGYGGDMTIAAGSAGLDGGLVAISAGSGDGLGGGISLTPGGGTSGRSGDITNRLNTGTEGNRSRYIVQANSGNIFTYRTVGSVSTTNATATTFDIVTPEASGGIFIEVYVTASRTGGTAGTADDSAAYIRRALYKRVASGAPALVGAIQDGFTEEDQAGWNCTLTVSSNIIQIQVTGAADNNIEWICDARFMTAGTGFIS